MVATKHGNFHQSQKQHLKKHTFPTNGNPFLGNVGVKIPTAELAEKIHTNKTLMAEMLEDGWKWMVTEKKNGSFEYGFKRYIEVNHVERFKTSNEVNKLIHYGVGLNISERTSVRDKAEIMLGINVEKKYNQFVMNLSNSLKISLSHANDILNNGVGCDVKNNPLIEE